MSCVCIVEHSYSDRSETAYIIDFSILSNPREKTVCRLKLYNLNIAGVSWIYEET